MPNTKVTVGMLCLVILGAMSSCPPGMVPINPANVDGACVDQFEANVEYFDEAASAWVPQPFNQHLDDLDASGRAVASTSGVLPQAYISQQQSAKACAAAEKRLCSLTEWMAACRGPSSTTYPYGTTYSAGFCNEGKPHPLVPLFGPGPWSYEQLNDPSVDVQPNTVSQTGAYAQCTNAAVGTFDMSGNLNEWVSTPSASGNAISKGGFFVDAKINGPGCSYSTSANPSTYHNYATGFRCCSGLEITPPTPVPPTPVPPVPSTSAPPVPTGRTVAPPTPEPPVPTGRTVAPPTPAPPVPTGRTVPPLTPEPPVPTSRPPTPDRPEVPPPVPLPVIPETQKPQTRSPQRKDRR